MLSRNILNGFLTQPRPSQSTSVFLFVCSSATWPLNRPDLHHFRYPPSVCNWRTHNEHRYQIITKWMTVYSKGPTLFYLPTYDDAPAAFLHCPEQFRCPQECFILFLFLPFLSRNPRQSSIWGFVFYFSHLQSFPECHIGGTRVASSELCLRLRRENFSFHHAFSWVTVHFPWASFSTHCVRYPSLVIRSPAEDTTVVSGLALRNEAAVNVQVGVLVADISFGFFLVNKMMFTL